MHVSMRFPNVAVAFYLWNDKPIYASIEQHSAVANLTMIRLLRREENKYVL